MKKSLLLLLGMFCLYAPWGCAMQSTQKPKTVPSLKYLTAGRVQQNIDNGITTRVEIQQKLPEDLNYYFKLLSSRKFDPTRSFVAAFESGMLTCCLARDLLDAGADINKGSSDIMEKTALIVAAKNQDKELLGLLLERGASVNQCSEFFGSNALYYATESGNCEIAQLLIDNGADVIWGNKEEKPLFIAALNGHYDILQLLLNHGAQKTINCTAWPDQETALTMAASCGRNEIVKLLLQYNADPKPNRSGNTPLLKAAAYGHIAVVKILLDHGHDVDRKNDFGVTSLMNAAHNKQAETVSYLLQRGADETITDQRGETALDYALKKRHVNTIALLILPLSCKKTFQDVYNMPCELSHHIARFVAYTKRKK